MTTFGAVLRAWFFEVTTVQPGRILRFLDHEDPSLRLDHNPAA